MKLHKPKMPSLGRKPKKRGIASGVMEKDLTRPKIIAPKLPLDPNKMPTVPA